MPSAKFRKLPVVIEAIQLADDNMGEVADWCQGDSDYRSVQIATLEGVMTAQVGDWIIRGVSGEFYPCKPEIFSETYEPA